MGSRQRSKLVPTSKYVNCHLVTLVSLPTVQTEAERVIFRLLTKVPLAPGLPPPPKLDATVSKGSATTEYCDSQRCVAGDKQGRDGFRVISLVTVSGRLLSVREMRAMNLNSASRAGKSLDLPPKKDANTLFSSVAQTKKRKRKQ